MTAKDGFPGLMNEDLSKIKPEPISSVVNSRDLLISSGKDDSPEEKSDQVEIVEHKGTSNLETMMHMIKANIGTGVLAMPLAFKNGGLILSSVSLWIMAFICVHCMHILLKCYKHVTLVQSKQTDGKKMSEHVGYEDVVELCFKDKCSPSSKLPKYSRVFVSIFLVFGQLGFCCVYLVFVPTNLKQVIDFHYPSNHLSVQIIMCIILLPLILFCLIKNLRYLAPFSTFANFLMIASMIVILFELLMNGSLLPMNKLDMVAPYYNWPIYFSSTIYAFEGISLVLPVYHEMHRKQDFTPWNGVLNTAMTMVAVMYFSIGFFGYMKYGSESAASITLNLPVKNTVFQIIKICFAIAIFISYNLQFYVAAKIIWESIVESSKYLQSLAVSRSVNNSDQPSAENQAQITKESKFYHLLENMFRSFLVIFTFLLAISIPRIDLFISLVGAVASSTLAIIIPPILDLIMFYPTSKFKVTNIVKNCSIILFGVYIFAAGTWVSMSDIVKYFQG